MPKAKAAPSCCVNVAVCVMKPGPMAEVAIRNRAPSRDRLRTEANRLILVAGAAGGGAVCGVRGSWLVSDMASSSSLG
ncbi:hypothetical protein GCM10027063_09140 [Promicromonospora xylanilytica]